MYTACKYDSTAFLDQRACDTDVLFNIACRAALIFFRCAKVQRRSCHYRVPPPH